MICGRLAALVHGVGGSAVRLSERVQAWRVLERAPWPSVGVVLDESSTLGPTFTVFPASYRQIVKLDWDAALPTPPFNETPRVQSGALSTS